MIVGDCMAEDMMNKMEILKRISCGDISQVDSVEIRNQLSAYLLGQAQVALEANMKLTQTLDMLQDKYSEKINEFIQDNDDETAIQYLPEMINVISKCLASSNDIITSVMDNKQVQNLMIINQDNRQVNLGTESEEVYDAIEDPRSRAKIRDTVAKILEEVNKEIASNNIN